MNTRCSLIAFSLVLLGSASIGSAGPVHDAFLEAWRTGSVPSDAGPSVDDQGWPRALFDPVSPSLGWSELQVLADRRSLLIIMLASQAEAESVIREWSTRIASRQELEMQAIRDWDQGRYADCYEVCTTLEQRSDHPRSPDSRLIWSLRSMAAKERSSGVTVPSPGLWDGMLDLGVDDARRAWDFWKARHRAIGAPLIPAGTSDLASALWLAGLGNRGLTSEDIDHSTFAPELKAALGGAALGRDDLARHYSLYPDPPSGHALASHWAGGRIRLAPSSAEAAESLGAMASLPPSVRSEYLRRAADRRLSDGHWTLGHDNLAAAVEAAGPDMSEYRARLLRTECRRAEALDLHQGRPGDAERTRALRLTLPPEPDMGDAILDQARDIVRRGDAPDVGALGASLNTDLRQSLSDELWRIWALWGRRLIGSEAFDPRLERYSTQLDSLTSGPDTGFGEWAGLAVGAWLGTSTLRDEVVAWILDSGVERAGPGNLPAEPSPFPDWLKSEKITHIDRHALLGLSLLIGDARGQLACVVTMPRTGLTSRENLLFLYPVPFRAEVLDLLAAAADPALALSVARNESLFDPAVRSRSGALGWMQIMPVHYSGRGVVDSIAIWRIPAISVGKGIGLLDSNSERYGGDVYRTVAAYNAGPGAVDRWRRQLGGEPERATFFAWIGYPETQRYTEQVLIDRQIYGEILGSFPPEVMTKP